MSGRAVMMTEMAAIYRFRMGLPLYVCDVISGNFDDYMNISVYVVGPNPHLNMRNDTDWSKSLDWSKSISCLVFWY